MPDLQKSNFLNVGILHIPSITELLIISIFLQYNISRNNQYLVF
jgi:hypothetical protein